MYESIFDSIRHDIKYITKVIEISKSIKLLKYHKTTSSYCNSTEIYENGGSWIKNQLCLLHTRIWME